MKHSKGSNYYAFDKNSVLGGYPFGGWFQLLKVLAGTSHAQIWDMHFLFLLAGTGTGCGTGTGSLSLSLLFFFSLSLSFFLALARRVSNCT